jgi:predicted AAA+ superfamily ATPase
VTEELLDQAEERATDIVRCILAGELAPSPRTPIRPDDPLAPIWGLGHRGLAEDEDEAAVASESRSSGGDA